MKNTIKKSLSVLLSLLLVIGALSIGGFAAQSHDPIIVVSGMGAFPLYYVDENGEKLQVWAPSGDIIKDTVVSVLKKSLTEGGIVNGLLDGLYEDMFAYIACDETGKSINNIEIPLFPESVSHYPETFEDSDHDEDEVGIIKALSRQYGGDNVWFFNYDWRLDPLDDAAGLNSFIQDVKSQSGANSVTLVPCSMGGIVTNAYLYKFGHDDVSKIIYSMVASKGVDMVGRMFNREISVDINTVLEYFFSFEMGETLVQALVNAAQIGIGRSGIDDNLDRLIKKLLNAVNDKAYDELLTKTFANFPGIWAMTPDEYYDGAKESMFGGNMNAELEAKADEYHNNVITKAEELMSAAQDDGIDIYIIASYGFVGAPVTAAAREQTDCLIETKNESFGATIAKYGETLGKDYVAAGTNCADEGHDHLSGDGIIDASTAAFPETTWFIKNNRHVGMNCESDCAKLMLFLTETNGATVNSNEAFPQFNELDAITGGFSAPGEKQTPFSSFIPARFSKLADSLFTLIKYLINLIYQLISK